MSVQSFLQAAQLLYQNNLYNESLCLVCIAIDACATKEYPQLSTTKSYKQFLKNHFRTITRIGFPGVEASTIRIKINCEVNDLRPNSQGYVDMIQIIYHVLRCGLVHKCEIDKSICFTDQTMIGDWDADKFLLPKALILGLAAAAVEGASNSYRFKK